MDVANKFGPIRKGLLELVVLKVIQAHKVYAVDILHMLANTEFSTQDGTLYPLLSRLRREGAIAYEWAESENGPPRKYYHLTPSGQAQLDELETYLHSLNNTIRHIGEQR